MAICLLATLSLNAKSIQRMQVDGGGPGPYKAEITELEGMDGYSVFKPVDMKSASAVEGPLPVILFGNGGCARNSRGFFEFLTNIASHGYVIISNGIYADGAVPPQPRPAQQAAPAPQPQQTVPQPQQSAEDARKAMMDGFRKAEAQNVADAKDFLKALNHIERLSQNKKSEFYNAIDTRNVAAMGQSCGGGQALILGSSQDQRIRTTVVLNSGVAYLDDGKEWMVGKDALQDLGGPIVYIVGGKGDVAYANAADDFQRITKVPVALCNLNVGHGGTYGQAHGGSFADVTLLWLDLQFKGKKENEKVFRYSELPAYLKKEGWTIHQKNYDKSEEFHLWAPVENKETARRNDFGEVVQYTGVNDPTMTVCLPDKDKANGTAVLIYPGGGLMSLTWDSEAMDVAKYLNARGIAAVIVKYRLRTGGMRRPAPSQAAPGQVPAQAAPAIPDNPFYRAQGRIQDYGILHKANTNPSVPDPNDKSIDNAADDANRAYELTVQHAAQWNIDPAKIGVLGFSAGGGVELAAVMKADAAHMPAFIGTIYGPSLVDVDVPENAPLLYIATHAEHPNVAAGCLALFMEWRKAGKEAEIHVHGKQTGNYYGGGNSGFYNPLGGYWIDSFYDWMRANKLSD